MSRSYRTNRTYRILIGYDGSVDADGALHDMDLAGMPAKADVLLATFMAPWIPFGIAEERAGEAAAMMEAHRKAALEEARRIADRAAAWLRKRFPGWKVKAEAGVSAAAAGLLDLANRWNPDLIVLGSHGRTALGRLLMGSVSQNILHHAEADVRVTRPRIRKGKGALRILIGVDGSPGSELAVSAVLSRAWPKGTRAGVVAALDARDLPIFRSEADGPDPDAARKRRLRWLEGKAADAVARLAAAGIEASPVVVPGDPRSVLVKEAKAWGADCIFLGSRGLGAVDRFLIGSVSSSVANHAPCSVEVVRGGRLGVSGPNGKAVGKAR
jgi:nucleotide-binding universal stress UspA family protein